MSLSLVDARFLYARALGLARRGLVSLRTRGWRGTWQRVNAQIRPLPRADCCILFVPNPAPFSAFALPTSGSPAATIVIPVFNQFPHTLACLRALKAYPPAAPFEVIVVDDGSSDETPEALSQVGGLRYQRRASNGGFIAACNDGARVARGDIVVFLNNDTVPQPGWLDALLATFEMHPSTGVAGAQLLYPDGRLQEAGGVVFQDGSAWNYGRFEAPRDPRFGYLRDTDYVSGAAIAVRRVLFERLGGFAERYAPAYYEDTDLAFAVRSAGHRVIYQPGARVVHDEGTTSGTNIVSGIKAYQVRNRGRFAERWRDALAIQPQPGTIPSPAIVHRAQRQILLVDALTPQPDRDSGSLRLVNLMRLLREGGAHVVFLPSNLAHDGRYTEALQQLGVEAWYAPFASRAPAWLREHGPRFDRVMVCRHYVASEFLPLLRRHAPQAKVLFDSVDLHYLRERRAAELIGDARLLHAAQRTKARELAVIAQADVTLVVSPQEQALLAQDAPGAPVELLSNLHEVAGTGLSFAHRRDVVFVGGFRHPPNVDAVRWFVREAWPEIRAEAPEAVFHCIGGDVPPEIAALASEPNVRVHGYVPDIAPYMHGVRVAVAPLRYGAGVKGKINLSMAHGQPVVATSCAVEGMHLSDGNDVLVADGAQAFAEAVVRLYKDEGLWRQLAANGLDNVRRHFSLDAARATVRRLFLD